IGQITITEVTVTDDLRLAKVYVATAADPGVRAATMQALERATSFLRAQLGARIRIRYTPELRFFYDDTLDRAERIDRLLRDAGADHPEV
ncbi:MAG: 30S ribosome-binding factor RbfA, partial [candidate division KSB1 bacterium]|nr:30S ribosome-binding factor RbfA [candidate division KSB1 bacterium]